MKITVVGCARRRYALVDVTNSSSYEAGPVMEFFTTSATNLVDAARRAGVGHYVAITPD